MKLKCVIIDDDVVAIDILKSYMANLPELEVVNIYTDSLHALTELVKSENLDIVFMDIDMPMINGLDLSKAIRHKTNKLIFVTSHSKYALKAFELHASAYLTKPFSFARFTETMLRMYPDMVKSPVQDIKATDEFFFVKNKNDNNNLFKVNYKEIIAIEGLQNYVRLYTTFHEIVAYFSLTETKAILKDHDYFIQVHRSFIISKNFIFKVDGNVLNMSNGLEISMGNNYREEIQSFIKEKTIKSGRL